MVSFTRSAVRSAPAATWSKAGRILAIDYGRRRIGLAISDDLGIIARPLAALQRKNRRDDMRRLRQIARENGAVAIIVGLPLHLSGRRGDMAAEAEQFAARIQKELGVPVELFDERLTSWEAEQLVKEAKSARKQDLDSLAAAILLQEYLKEARIHQKSEW